MSRLIPVRSDSSAATASLQDVAARLDPSGHHKIVGRRLSAVECPLCGGNLGRRGKRNRRVFYVTDTGRGLVACCHRCGEKRQSAYAQALGVEFIESSYTPGMRSFQGRGEAERFVLTYLHAGVIDYIGGLGEGQAADDTRCYLGHLLPARRRAAANGLPWNAGDAVTAYSNVFNVFHRIGRKIGAERVRAVIKLIEETFGRNGAYLRLTYLLTTPHEAKRSVNFHSPLNWRARSSAEVESREPESGSEDAPRGPPGSELQLARVEQRDGSTWVVFTVPEVGRHPSRRPLRRHGGSRPFRPFTYEEA